MTGAERGAAPRLWRITPTDHRVMPWKNGMGTTREIAIDPPGTAMADAGFRWRLSIADVGQSGPFSAFPGIDRTIMVINGRGMVLTVAGEAPRRLDRCFEAFEFSGDRPADCQLIDGPVQDFNLMVNRTILASEMEVRSLQEACEIPLLGRICLAHAFAGAVEISADSVNMACGAGETAIAESLDRTTILRISPRGTARIALMLLNSVE